VASGAASPEPVSEGTVEAMSFLNLKKLSDKHLGMLDRQVWVEFERRTKASERSKELAEKKFKQSCVERQDLLRPIYFDQPYEVNYTLEIHAGSLSSGSPEVVSDIRFQASEESIAAQMMRLALADRDEDQRVGVLVRNMRKAVLELRKEAKRLGISLQMATLIMNQVAKNA
jgi:RecA/RadA recombinase